MSLSVLAFLPQGPEMIFIFLLILLLFGAKKLPELAKGLGKSAGEFKKAKQEFEHEIKTASDEAEREWDEEKDKKSSEKKSSEKKSSDKGGKDKE